MMFLLISSFNIEHTLSQRVPLKYKSLIVFAPEAITVPRTCGPHEGQITVIVGNLGNLNLLKDRKFPLNKTEIN